MLDLHPETRSITVLLPSGPVTMCEPSIDGWRQIRAAYRTAEEKVTAADSADRSSVLFDDAVYAHAFAVAVTVCGSVAAPDPDRLPAAASSPDLYRVMHDMWTVPTVTVDGHPWTPGTPYPEPDIGFTPYPDSGGD